MLKHFQHNKSAKKKKKKKKIAATRLAHTNCPKMLHWENKKL